MEGNMKVAVMLGIGKMGFTTRPIPQPKDDEVLVRLEYVGICGSFQLRKDYSDDMRTNSKKNRNSLPHNNKICGVRFGIHRKSLPRLHKLTLCKDTKHLPSVENKITEEAGNFNEWQFSIPIPAYYRAVIIRI